MKRVARERVVDSGGMMPEQDGESQGKMVGIFRPFLTLTYQQVVMKKIRQDFGLRAIFVESISRSGSRCHSKACCLVGLLSLLGRRVFPILGT